MIILIILIPSRMIILRHQGHPRAVRNHSTNQTNHKKLKTIGFYDFHGWINEFKSGFVRELEWRVNIL